MKCFLEILKILETEIKPIALLGCLQENKLYYILSKGKNYDPTEDEKLYITKVKSKFKDINGLFCIFFMIYDVDEAINNGQIVTARHKIEDVYCVLTNPNYFKNVFKGEANQEWQTRIMLKEALDKFLMHISN